MFTLHFEMFHFLGLARILAQVDIGEEVKV